MKARRGWIVPYGKTHDKEIRRAIAAGGQVAALVYFALYSECDSYGRFPADPADLALYMPALMLSDEQAAAALDALSGEGVGLIRIYQLEGESFGEIVGWDGKQAPELLKSRGRPTFPPWPDTGGAVAQIPNEDRQAAGQRQPGGPSFEGKSPTTLHVAGDKSPTSGGLVSHFSPGTREAVPDYPPTSGRLETPPPAPPSTDPDSDKDPDPLPEGVSRESSSSPEDPESLAARVRARGADDDDSSASRPPEAGRPDRWGQDPRWADLFKLLTERCGGKERTVATSWIPRLMELTGGNWPLALAAAERAGNSANGRVSSWKYLAAAVESMRAVLADAKGRLRPSGAPAKIQEPTPDELERRRRQADQTRRTEAARLLYATLPVPAQRYWQRECPGGVPPVAWAHSRIAVHVTFSGVFAVLRWDMHSHHVQLPPGFPGAPERAAPPGEEVAAAATS